MQSKYFKILLVLLIMTGLLYAPIYRAQQAQAGFFGILGNCLKTVVLRAIISFGVTVLLSFLFLVPTDDLPSLSQALKEYIKDPLARCIARGVFDETVGAMLDVVRKKGRDGGASYIRNWRNFQTQGQYRGEDVFRGIIANTEMCDFLRQDVNNSFGINSQSKISLSGINLRINSLHPFALQGKCPLPPGFNLAAYEQDPIANGGWDAFNRMLLPSGHQSGINLMAQGELYKQRSAEEEADLHESQASQGALGLRGSEIPGTFSNPNIGEPCQFNRDCEYGSDTSVTCVGKPGICTQTGTPPVSEPSCLIPGPNGKCIKYADIRTPGSYITETLSAQIQQEMAWITNVDELRELVINYIYTRLSNRLKDIGADEELPQYTDAESGFSPDGTTVTGGVGGTTGGGGGLCQTGQTATPAVLSVQCSATGNVLSWTTSTCYLFNYLFKNVPPCPDINSCPSNTVRTLLVQENVNTGISTFTYTDNTQGQVSYYHKAGPPNALASNFVQCPSGAGNPSPSPTPNATCLQNCTGNNPDCICVREAPPSTCSDPSFGQYDKYEGAACTAIQNAYSAPCNNTVPIPTNVPSSTVLTNICNAYNAAPPIAGTSCVSTAGDVINIRDPKAPNPTYPVVAVDVFAGSPLKFWASRTSACK